MKPNIVLIFADDMGYGDLSCQNPESKIDTPTLDGIAARGVRFDDAHAASSVCSPSRYAVLTGRYAWRGRLKKGVLGGYSHTLIEDGRLTVGDLLRDHGYHTACIGKWHLGWEWQVQGTEDGGPKTEDERLRAEDGGHGTTASRQAPVSTRRPLGGHLPPSPIVYPSVAASIAVIRNAAIVVSRPPHDQ